MQWRHLVCRDKSEEIKNFINFYGYTTITMFITQKCDRKRKKIIEEWRGNFRGIHTPEMKPPKLGTA